MKCQNLLSLKLAEKLFWILECVLKGHRISERIIADVQPSK